MARTSKINLYVRPGKNSINEVSILRSNFDFSMLILYLVFTVCAGTNINKFLKDIHLLDNQFQHYQYFQTFLVA
jgi:hypothetical protein